MKRLTTTLSALLAGVLACALFAPVASAYSLQDLDVSFTNKDGSPATLAGSHPYAMTTTFGAETELIAGEEGGDPVELELPTGEIEDLTVELPPGLAGDSLAVPTCAGADFATIDTGRFQPGCSSDTAVGVIGLRADFEPINPSKENFKPGVYSYFPVYNLDPPPGAAASFGFIVYNVPITFDVGVSHAPPYNLEARISRVSQYLFFYGSKLTIWGNPSDPSHDALRGQCLEPRESNPQPVSAGDCPVSSATQRPLLTLPRSCQGPLTTTFHATSWKGEQAEGTATTKGMSGCASLDFAPNLGVRPTTSAAESPTGLDVDLDINDEGLTDRDGRAQSDVRNITVALPEGVTANPSAADGLGACTPAQLAAASFLADGCPRDAKLGEVLVRTPLLGEALEGSLYVALSDDPGTAQPGAENPFDSLLVVYLVIRHPKLGILVTQAGEVRPDPRTGQLTASFKDVPQFPLSHVGVRFKEGPRAPLVTPPLCGSYTVLGDFEPWSGGGSLPTTSTFSLAAGPEGRACPAAGAGPFSPALTAGTLKNAAGEYSPFYLRVTRRDGEQELTRFDATLPQGVLGRIAGASRCSEAAISAAGAKSGRAELAAPSCPLGSEVGRVLTGAGVGQVLTYVPGKLYLAGPFEGAPLSVVAIVPGVAGPFDVGTVVVRQGLRLNPLTAEVQIKGSRSTPIPHILEGIPVRVRDVRVYADRPRFTLNATSCQELSTRARLFGSSLDQVSLGDDRAVAVQSRYQAADCLNRGFAPKLSLRLKGGTKRSGHPALKAVVRTSQGPDGEEANIARAVVRLPHSAFLDQSHIRTICTRVQYAAKQCPPAAIYGFARARSPLIDGTFAGPVYLRSSDNPLPDLVAALKGPESAPFEIELVGRIDAVRGGIRTSFASVPDAPVSSFTLEMQGGKKGLIVNSRDLCRSINRAAVGFTGQNGLAAKSRVVVRPNCGRKASRRTR